MEKIEIYSPIDKSLIGSVASMKREDIDKKVEKLELAFKKYKEKNILKRAEELRKAGEKLLANKEELARLLCLEVAKSYKDSLAEIERSIEMLNYTVEEALRLEGELHSGDSMGANNKISLVLREPLGLILCIAPFNYPINLSLSKIVPALIMGNVVLYKPPTQGSYTCTRMIELMNEELSSGVLEIVTGRGSEIGDYINTIEEVKMINFTGSTGVGKRIAHQAGMKRLIMELGGKDAAIVLDDADLNKASDEIIKGAFSYSGQRCTAIKRVLVDNKIADKLVELLLEKVNKLTVGNPLENKDITPLIDDKSADYVYGLIMDAKESGATILTEIKRENNLIYPVLIDNVNKDMRVAIEEPFGPVLPIIRISSVEEAIEIANSSEYGLQSSVFTKDYEKAFKIARKLEVGTVQINNRTQRGPDNFPFLGIKNSGLGIQGIKESLLSVCKIKSIVLDI